MQHEVIIDGTKYIQAPESFLDKVKLVLGEFNVCAEDGKKTLVKTADKSFDKTTEKTTDKATNYVDKVNELLKGKLSLNFFRDKREQEQDKN